MSFALHPKSAELPEKHRAQIGDQLTRLFGTPLKPRFLLAEGEPVEGAEPKLTPVMDEDRLARGAELFQRNCASCHGATGDGNGEASAYLLPKPRDYRSGVFKFTSTPYGSKPARQDLIRFIRKGAKGTSMPGFPWFPDEEIEALVDYVIMIAHRGELEQLVAQIAAVELEPDQDLLVSDFTGSLAQIHERWVQAEREVVFPLSPQPPLSDETVLLGRQAFVTRGCSKCHGEDGRGQTDWLSKEFVAQQQSLPEDQRIQINFDIWGNVAPAADLTAGMLHGGRRRVDIYRRIHNGINGTPVPAFAQSLAEEPETIWLLVHYILNVVEGRPLPSGAPVPDTTTASAE
jgi:mono/diheme cytochrome c family protein